MPAFPFDINEYEVPCQYIREYPHATRGSAGVLKIAVKEYIHEAGQEDGLTVISATANGVPKVSVFECNLAKSSRFNTDSVLRQFLFSKWKFSSFLLYCHVGCLPLHHANISSLNVLIIFKDSI